MLWKNTRKDLLQKLLAHQRIGLIADMDGTLSHIVPRPDDARVTSRNIALLSQLQQQLPLVAILSGRAASALNKLVGIPGLVYVGNHGLERWSEGRVQLVPEAEPFRSAVHNAYQALLPYENDGVFIENKAVTLSLHYRRAADPASAAVRLLPVLQKTAADHGLDLFQGRMVYELRPPIACNKGTAFHSLIKDFALDAALFLGDDTTDIPALKKAQELRNSRSCFAIGVGVVSEESPPGVAENADILVDGVGDVEEFLDWLQRAQTASAT